MNQEIKAKWLEALRSGNYQQDTNALRTNFGFCCLGVLCDIIEPDSWLYINIVDNRTVYSFRNCTEDLPPDIRKIADIASTESNVLVDMNDSGFSFAQIADFIEENL